MITTTELKTSLIPERYYSRYLNGSWGKVTGNGWHQWNGLCPFHDDRRAGSFVINKATGAFNCFSCGSAGGDIIDFHMKANNIGFKDAFNQLKEVTQCGQ
jgi:putative DNA primase/helicase